MENEKYINMLTKLDMKNTNYSAPFPIGVFGTLKLGCGNNYLMGNPPNSKSKSISRRGNSSEYSYKSHHKAFMPHFSASGLSISFDEGKAAVFEIFTYEPSQWDRMIINVDSLESFSPNRTSEYEYGYFRTLALLRVLPNDYESPFYSLERLSYGEKRILPIPEKEWTSYPICPCWVYSSKRENLKCLEKIGPFSWESNQPIVRMGW